MMAHHREDFDPYPGSGLLEPAGPQRTDYPCGAERSKSVSQCGTEQPRLAWPRLAWPG